MSLPKLTDLRDVDQIKLHRPLLIAHRGGVIAAGAPENSLPAIRLAAEEGYHLVELDVRASSDGVPVLFHGIGAGGYLGVDCGVEANIVDLTAAQIRQLRYRGTDEPVVFLEDALFLCAELGLGVMFDIKEFARNEFARNESAEFVQQISRLTVDAGIERISMTISRHPLVEELLHPAMLRRTSDEHETAVRNGERFDLRGWFWFEHPAVFDGAVTARMQEMGALILPTVNSFRYPKHDFGQLAAQDIEMLKQGNVDGFQIDSPYRQYVIA